MGVAIATALMPPLAVVAFGLATGDMRVAGARCSFHDQPAGDCPERDTDCQVVRVRDGELTSPHRLAGGVIATTFILLALPLGLAREIGQQTWAANQARAVVTGTWAIAVS